MHQMLFQSFAKYTGTISKDTNAFVTTQHQYHFRQKLGFTTAENKKRNYLVKNLKLKHEQSGAHGF